jgi:hypothetical protein
MQIQGKVGDEYFKTQQFARRIAEVRPEGDGSRPAKFGVCPERHAGKNGALTFHVHCRSKVWRQQCRGPG